MKIIILHNIRSHYNVGAIMRTADAAGVSRIYLCGYTPTPTDRFGRAVKALHKTALGAEMSVPWIGMSSTQEAIEECRREGYVVVAVEQSKQAISLKDFFVPNKVAYVFGSEVEGVAEDIVAACDVVLYIPMSGQKESLNVSVAAGIVLYH
jgi:23S rRNA (guanosine2251-2'-O)-methyltransferase